VSGTASSLQIACSFYEPQPMMSSNRETVSPMRNDSIYNGLLLIVKCFYWDSILYFALLAQGLRARRLDWLATPGWPPSAPGPFAAPANPLVPPRSSRRRCPRPWACAAAAEEESENLIYPHEREEKKGWRVGVASAAINHASRATTAMKCKPRLPFFAPGGEDGPLPSFVFRVHRRRREELEREICKNRLRNRVHPSVRRCPRRAGGAPPASDSRPWRRRRKASSGSSVSRRGALDERTPRVLRASDASARVQGAAGGEEGSAREDFRARRAGGARPGRRCSPRNCPPPAARRARRRSEKCTAKASNNEQCAREKCQGCEECERGRLSRTRRAAAGCLASSPKSKSKLFGAAAAAAATAAVIKSSCFSIEGKGRAGMAGWLGSPRRLAPTSR